MTIESIIEQTEDLNWVKSDLPHIYDIWRSENGCFLIYDEYRYYIELKEDLEYSHRHFEHPTAVVNYIKRFSDPFLVLNSSMCKVCNTTLVSLHRHSMVGCKCPEDTRLWIDGGNAYKRIVGAYSNALSKDVMSNAGHSVLREALHRGSRGKDGHNPLTWIKLCDMSDEHLVNTIKYIEEFVADGNLYYSIYLSEVDYRREHNISIKE